MIYLIDPCESMEKACPKDCPVLCRPVFCAVKPLYGISP
jgi:hypothetical protein